MVNIITFQTIKKTKPRQNPKRKDGIYHNAPKNGIWETKSKNTGVQQKLVFNQTKFMPF